MATALAAVPGGRDLWRVAIIATGAAAILAPVALVVYQSFLSAPFFSARARFSLDGYAFVLADEDFWVAGLNSVILAASMVAIAVPVGAALAYLVVRTDLPDGFHAPRVKSVSSAPAVVSSPLFGPGPSTTARPHVRLAATGRR